MIYLVFPNPVDEGPQESLWTKINRWGDGVQNMAANKRQSSLREGRSGRLGEEKMLVE